MLAIPAQCPLVLQYRTKCCSAANIDLQEQCRYVIHYDLEWNRMGPVEPSKPEP
jgi:hypothetical protein